MRVLCFTTSYNRPKMLRSCIQDIQNQSYPNIHHAINIAYNMEQDYSCMYDDIGCPCSIHIVYNLNSHQQINHINAIKAVDYESFLSYKDFDLFIKIDDDDIYKKEYVRTIVEYFNTHEVDIVSSKISTQLNGHNIHKEVYEDLGANPEGTNYAMPMTFAFNRKALDIILPIDRYDNYEDKLWRDDWTKAELIHEVIENDNNVIWYIHGANISTSSFLE